MEKNFGAIIDYLKSNRIDVYGTAGSASLEGEPEGYRPSDLLDGVAGVLCLGVPFPKGIFAPKNRSTRLYWRTANVYYRHIDALLARCAAMIETSGQTALPVFGCYPYDVLGKGDFWGYISLVRMAEATGIGVVGKNGLLINPVYGPRLMLGGLVTTAELPRVRSPELPRAGCPDDCFICQEACPAGAIEKSGRVDRIACVKHSSYSPLFSFFMSQGGGGGGGETDPARAELINHLTAVDDHSMYTCIECVATCPL